MVKSYTNGSIDNIPSVLKASSMSVKIFVSADFSPKTYPLTARQFMTAKASMATPRASHHPLNQHSEQSQSQSQYLKAQRGERQNDQCSSCLGAQR